MYDISDGLLYEAYTNAIQSQLDREFIQLLEDEIDRRGFLKRAKKTSESDEAS